MASLGPKSYCKPDGRLSIFPLLVITLCTLCLLHLPKTSDHENAATKSLQSCPTLRDPIDGSPPGSPVPGILQARTLEWGAISSSTSTEE